MKMIYRTFVMAFTALTRNIMRSALTTLGIIIGVAAVIIMVGIGQGTKKMVAETIQRMGANTLLVLPGAASSGGVSFGSGSAMTLTPADAVAIEKECRANVSSVAPIVRARTQVVFGNKNWVPPSIYGTTPSFLDVRDWSIDEGRNFTDQEVNGGAEVCVIGQTLVRELFNGQSPLGEVIRVNNHPMTVVGTLTRKGANMMGMDQDDIVIAPWRTVKFKVAGTSATTANQSAAATSSTTASSSSVPFPSQQPSPYPTQSSTEAANNPPPLLPTNVDQIMVRAASEEQIQPAMKQITAILHERHRIRRGEPDDFNLRDMTEFTKAQGETTELMGTLLLCVAFISLIVGGVGIMNIMLVSVTERTREIGLRMAVGARARDILKQFLVEAILLCLLGGIVGILMGCLGTVGIRKAGDMGWMRKWPTEISGLAILASVAVSAVVGVAFGFYPAWKASRLDPIEALRYE